MTPEQFGMCKKAFEETTQELLRAPTYADGWAACLHANGIGEEPRIPEGYFKIGEEVECKTALHEWQKGIVVAVSKNIQTELPEHVRRIPAWKPVDLIGKLVRARQHIGEESTIGPLESFHTENGLTLYVVNKRYFCIIDPLTEEEVKAMTFALHRHKEYN